MNTMKCAIIAVVATGCGAFGGVSTWNPAGTGGWADDSRWTLAAPGAGDTVDFNGCTGVVAKADAATLANIAKITLTGAGSGLIISNDVADGDFEFSKPVSGDGVLIKKGDGITRMTYAETTEKTGYWMGGGLEVLDGTLILPRSPAVDLYLAKLMVMDPGVFVHTGNKYTRVLGGLWGTGVVSNDVSKPMYLGGGSAAKPAVFSGRFSHLAYPCMYDFSSSANKVQHFTGTDSDNSQSVLLYCQDGTVGLAKFGNSKGDGKSSAGAVGRSLQYRGLRNRYLYLGEDETTDREINFGAGGRDARMDAGEHGGLTFTKKVSVSASENNFMNVFTLLGNGENVFDMSYASVTNPQGRYISHYIVKDGNGSWRFTSGKTRTAIGTVAVRKGVLKFDSISERGTDCAMGPANLTQSRYYGNSNSRTIDDSKTVPYAFLLGNGEDGVDAEHLATLDYTGTSSAEVHTRAIALNGVGRLRSSSASIIWDGVTAASNVNNTLVVDAPECPIALTVTNGPGTVGVVKEGAGMCVLNRECDFTGGLSVKDGTLRVSGKKYDWYRFTVTETWHHVTNSVGVELGGNGGSVTMRQFALMDENGVNQILNLPHNKAADTKPWLLAPGEAAIGCDSYRILGTDDYGRDITWALSNLFTTAATDFGAVRLGVDGYTGFNSDPKRQVSIVLRLPAGANPVTRYDIRNQGFWLDNSSAAHRMPRAWTIEGSPDGITWDMLHVVTTNDNTYANIPTGERGHWYSNNSTTMGLGYGPLATERTGAATAAHPSSVGVAAGANLEIAEGAFAADGIAYDCSTGAGTFAGIAFTLDAKVDLVGFTESMLGATLPASFVNCTGLAGRNWKVMLNGTLKPSYFARLDANGIRVFRHGLHMIFR